MLNIFENCWLLLTLTGIALVAASIVRQEKPEWGYKPLLVPLLLAALAFGLDYAFTTDYEAVNAILPACKKAAVDKDVDAIMNFVSPNYADSRHHNRDALRADIERVIPRASINRIRTQSHIVTIEGEHAQSEFIVGVHLNKDSGYAATGSLVMVEMKFEYEKIAEKWYIQRMELTSLNYQPSKWNDIP
ncbi:MAG: nuclear transport factor 2 family protein [Planctomycetota bacterium]|jgi:hypothetical protein